MTEITLTAHNMFYAGLVGVSRHVKGMHKPGTYGINNSTQGWQCDCDGACGELAVAKYLGVYWDGAMGDFTATDAGQYQVRTNSNHWGHLLLHPKDKDTDIFILVLSHNSPAFVLAGWCYGSEGKQQEYWKEKVKGRPCYFVPQSTLRPMDELCASNRSSNESSSPVAGATRGCGAIT